MSRIPNFSQRQPLPPELDAFAWSARMSIAGMLFRVSVRLALLGLWFAPWAKPRDGQ